MLKRHYQLVFWGKSPWSLLHALLWRKRGREVLVIDDPNLSTLASFNPLVTALELGALADLGRRFDVGLLGRLSLFLKPSALVVHTAQLRWTTGASVRDNLRELIRKFPRFQTPTLLAALELEGLEGDYQSTVTQYLEWFRSDATRRRSRRAPYRLASAPWLRELQTLFEQELAADSDAVTRAPLKELVTAFFAALGQVVKYGVNGEESAAVLLQLLSPVQRLDQRWLERELLRELALYDGHVKLTRVQSWQDWQGRLDALLLDSYEGVLTFDRLLIYGDPSPAAELELGHQQRVFRGVVVRFDLPAPPALRPSDSPVEFYAHASRPMLGTDMPVVLFQRRSTEVVAQVLVLERPAAKVEFYLSGAQALIAQILEQGAPWGLHSRGELVAQESWGLWLEEPERAPGLGLHQRRAIQVKRRADGVALNGVDYWGCLIGERFGATGYLTELVWDIG